MSWYSTEMHEHMCPICKNMVFLNGKKCKMAREVKNSKVRYSWPRLHYCPSCEQPFLVDKDGNARIAN